jgi:aminoglycoside phosphotransferase (APT) family kinase protein
MSGAWFSKVDESVKARILAAVEGSSQMNGAAANNETDEIARALTDMGLLAAGAPLVLTALSGGVSCDVWRADLAGGPVCVKRALPKLRVEADWRAPAERAASEAAWFRLVADIDRTLVPRVRAEDRARHLFVMEYLPPETHPVWKAQLAEGIVDVDFAAAVGTALARIHAATADRPDIAARFANRGHFHALRIAPYLLTAAEKNPGVAAAIRAIAGEIESARIALMHGDVSPKNILCGPQGPVFLDAETTSYGDPAFDLAFCLNHLLLKCIWHPRWAHEYLESFSALKSAYLAGVRWEDASALEARAARLLPALLLARVDGKSPVEYLTEDSDKAFVRETALTLLGNAGASLGEIACCWADAVDLPS